MKPSDVGRKLSRIPQLAKNQIEDIAEMIRYYQSPNSRSIFNLKSYQEGFRDRLDRNAFQKDKPLLERILKAYQAAKRDEMSAPKPYRLRGEWRHIIDVEYARLLDALKKEDLRALGALLANFCRNECSRGLAMGDAFMAGRRRPFLRFRFINQFNECYLNWQKETGDSFEPGAYAYPTIGNLIGMKVGDAIISYPNIRHRYYAKRLLSLSSGQEMSVAEIGGGFGGMAYFLFKEFSGKLSYLNVDLPEMNVVNSYFLLKSLPDKKIALYGEHNEALSSVMAQSDVTIYPHYAFPKLSDRSVDIVFNSCSLSEMDEETVAEYYLQIARVCRGYFFHVNHDDETVYDVENNKKHVVLSKHQLPTTSFKTVIYKKTAFFNPKYFEYLYQYQGNS